MKTKSASFFMLAVVFVSVLFMLPQQAIALLRYGEILCRAEEGYTCLTVQRGDSWKSLFPDENQRALEMRINRMNVPLVRGVVIAVADNLDRLDYRQLSPFAAKIDPTGTKTVIVDPTLLAFGAYDEEGNLLRWGPASLGRNWCSDLHANCHTKVGSFKIYEKRGEECFSSKFPIPDGGAPMPYCMFFNRGYALHASELPGFNASHGCVRLFYEDAEWLNHEFAEIGTQVIVKSYEA